MEKREKIPFKNYLRLVFFRGADLIAPKKMQGRGTIKKKEKSLTSSLFFVHSDLIFFIR